MSVYSFSTVFLAIIASNALLILLTLFFSNTKIMANAGYKLLALFVALTALRFLLPVEFPFTISIILKEQETISRVISYVSHPLYTISNVEISIWSILQLVWGIGFLFLFIRYIQEHRKARYFILANSLDATDNEPYHSMLNQICKERHKRNRFRVLTMTGITKPMLYGVFFPCILLPEGMELSEENLYFSLAHEAAHHFHHDLLIKKMVRIISMIYWWNPISHVLVRKANVILEMRVDDAVTASGKETIMHYLHSLIAIGESSLAAEASRKLTKSVTMSLLFGEDKELTQRYYMLVSSGKKKNKLLNLALLVLVVGIYVTSYMFIVEAHYTPPSVQEESIAQTAENSYAILKEDGTYDIYYYNYFVENVDSLDYYSSDIPIYTEKEITHEEH